MKKMFGIVCTLFALLVCQINFAGNGSLFNVSATGSPGNVNITLCLNGTGPLSCQNYTVNALNLSIRTTVLHHTYPTAGIFINTPGYTIANLGIDCIQASNRYCLFSISDTTAKTISISGNHGPLTLSPQSLPAATLNAPYNQTIYASGGVAPYTYAVTSGALPIGTSVDAATGVISGTPTIDSTYSFTVTATDANSDTVSQAYSVVVSGPLVISPSTLPAATLNATYNQTLTASGGVAPYMYVVTSGTLPTGLSLNTATGVISGTPTTDSTYSFTVTATDFFSNTGSKAYSVVVSGPLVISPSTLPAATMNTAYSQTLTASGGVAPYSYAVTSGSLPAGLSLDLLTGVISGTPTTSNTYNFTVTTTDAISDTGSQAYSVVVIGSQIIFLTNSTFNGNLGGLSGADNLCNADSAKPNSGFSAGYTYKALLNNNNATANGVTYYRPDGTTLIAQATGGNLVGAGSLNNAISTSNVYVWTGADNSTTPCVTSGSIWTNATNGINTGSIGSANATNSQYWEKAFGVSCANLPSHLYCVSQ